MKESQHVEVELLLSFTKLYVQYFENIFLFTYLIRVVYPTLYISTFDHS